MSIELELRQLEVQYRYALSGAVAAKARYLASADSRRASPTHVAALLTAWLSLVERKRALARRMSALEQLEKTGLH